jgi:hypothetical protein
MPSKAASACDSCHVGWHHRRAAQRRKRLGIMRCQRHHQPHARCRKQKRLPHGLSPLPIVARRAEKRVPPRNAIDRLAASTGIRSAGFGVASGGWILF